MSLLINGSTLCKHDCCCCSFNNMKRAIMYSFGYIRIERKKESYAENKINKISK